MSKYRVRKGQYGRIESTAFITPITHKSKEGMELYLMLSKGTAASGGFRIILVQINPIKLSDVITNRSTKGGNYSEILASTSVFNQ